MAKATAAPNVVAEDPDRINQALRELHGAADLPSVVEVLLPGAAAATIRLRNDVLALSEDVLARGAIISGAPGTGKSTIARLIALGRYLSRVGPQAFTRILKSMSLDGPGRLGHTKMDWFREMSLAGLVTTLADMQLFGIEPKSASDVDPRPGIFQHARMGNPKQGEPTLGAQVTGGVVFLDEVAEAPSELQAKLLTVLTGTMVYPVGAEGDEARGFVFDGLTIAATWRSRTALRDDLRARLSEHVIEMPSLEARAEDMSVIARSLIAEGERRRERIIQQLSRLPGIDETRISKYRVHVKLSEADIKLLREVPWSRLGELRGLGQVLNRVMRGDVSVKESVERHFAASGPADEAQQDTQLFEAIMALPSPPPSLASAVKLVEIQTRRQMVIDIRRDDFRIHQLANHLHLGTAEVKKRLSDLPRQKSRQTGS